MNETSTVVALHALALTIIEWIFGCYNVLAVMIIKQLTSSIIYCGPLSNLCILGRIWLDCLLVLGSEHT